MSGLDGLGWPNPEDEPQRHPSDAAACSVALLTSVPQHDGGFFPVLHVDHQLFSFGMQVETQAEADWYCAQMRTALERAGCRVRPQNAGGMARELAALDSDNTNDLNG
jgi:hypothetical protein